MYKYFLTGLPVVLMGILMTAYIVMAVNLSESDKIINKIIGIILMVILFLSFILTIGFAIQNKGV